MMLARSKTGTLEDSNSCGTQPSTNDPKKDTDTSIASAPPRSRAARLNTNVLRKLQAAFDNNPEVDLLTKMPQDYSTRLTRLQKEPPPEEVKAANSRFNGRARSVRGLINNPEQRNLESCSDSKPTSVMAFELRIPLK